MDNQNEIPAIVYHFGKLFDDREREERLRRGECPDCGLPLAFEGGCEHCPACGWEACDN